MLISVFSKDSQKVKEIFAVLKERLSHIGDIYFQESSSEHIEYQVKMRGEFVLIISREGERREIDEALQHIRLCLPIRLMS